MCRERRGRRNTTITTRPKCYWDIWVNWTCSPMRTRICVVLAVDVSLSQWERNQRINLRLSWATLHFTDRWAASQPPPQGDKLTYLARMCVSVWMCMNVCVWRHLHHWLSVWCYSIFPSLLCRYAHVCVRWMDSMSWGMLLSIVTVTRWLAASVMVFEPGHLTRALTLIAHCSDDRRGDREVKTSWTHMAQGIAQPARAAECVRLCVWFFLKFVHLIKTHIQNNDKEAILREFCLHKHTCVPFHLRHRSWPFYCWPWLHVSKQVWVQTLFM